MNKRLTTIFMTLLLCILGATNAWAQSLSYQSSYSTNFLNYSIFSISTSSTNNYVGTRANVEIGSETYPGVVAYLPTISGSFKPQYATMRFFVPMGTKYLYLHAMGQENNLPVDVYVGGTKFTTLQFKYDSGDISSSSSNTIAFKGSAAKKYYLEIEFNEPLPENTVIGFKPQTADKSFFIFGVYYEDGYSPHKGSERNPFTAGEAYALARDYIKLTGQKYVKGLISTTPDIITEGSPRTASFSISDDATHTNEIAVSGCYSFNGGEFTYENDLLPRDKVMLRGNILPKPNAGLASVGNNVPTLISQIHPTYEALVVNESTGSATIMTNHYDSDNPFDWPIHDYNVGHLDASESNYFSFREYYSDDPENMKTLFAANPNGESGYHVVSWETMDNISLTDASNGRLMRVDTDGDHYSLSINQVADGPTLDVRGFEAPQFYLHTSGGWTYSSATYELVLDDDYVYRASGIELQNLQDFWITKGQNGTVIYGSPVSGNNIINQENCSSLPVVNNDCFNFTMGVTGTFDFDFFVDTSNGSATLNVRPTSGEWPVLRPVYWLGYSTNGDDVMLKFHDNGDGTYTLTDSGLSEVGSGFWFKRQLGNGPIEQYAGSGGTNMRLHKYNSTYVDLIAGGSDFKMAGNASEKTFTITETAEGPELTITGWPKTYISFAYDPGSGPSQVGVFDHDEETDTYSFTYTVSKDGGFYFIDTAFGVPFSATTEEAFILSRHNSTDILATFDGSPYFKTINDGTYTFKLTPFNDSYMLTVEGWPDPIYKPYVADMDMPAFVKNDDGSYSTTINVTADMLGTNGKYSFDILDQTEGTYYGIPSTIVSDQGGLSRYNCVDVPLGTGTGYCNISLTDVGEYTLTISTNFKLTIDWPHKDYLLTYRPADQSIIPSTVPFEYYAGIYTVPDLRLGEGYEFWVSDPSGTGYGLSSNYLSNVIYESNSTGIELVEGGSIAEISQPGKYTFTMRESGNSDYDLQMDITGWAERTWAIRFLNGTSYTDVPLVYDSQEEGYMTMTTVKEGRKFVVADNFGFTFGVPSSTTLEGNNLVRLFEDIDENTDYMQMLTSGTYTFLVAEDDRGMYIRVSTMGNLIAGGDAESGATGYFLMKESPNSTIQDARVVEGAGKDGSKAFVIHSVANPTQEWDTQFFIELSQPLPEGTKYRISFDYKADLYASGVTTQTHGEPGEYITYTAIGNVDFADYWRHFEYEGTVSHTQSPTCNMRTIAFMLAKTTDANTLYFDNIEFEIAEGAPVMVDIIKNGNIEADDMSCFKKIEQVGNHPGELVTANFTEGVGKNGSRGIVVQSRDNPDPSGVLNDWDTQFFVRLPQTLPAGTKYRISFDYRANKEATAYTQMHAEPANYLNYTGIGNVNFNIGWQHFEESGIITNAQSPQDNMQTVCFCLAVKKSATTYYFDNFVFEIDEDHVAQVLPGDVNGDGTVTIQDVVAIVDYTLGKGSSAFNEKAADVTGDGQINVSDVVTVVNILLGKSN